MRIVGAIGIAFCLCVSANQAADSGETGEKTVQEPEATMAALVGSWEGSCRTWFVPGQLADESEVKGEIAFVLNGRFLRHSYEGSINDQARTGEELIAFNAVTKRFQIAWIDDFHTSGAILFSTGEPNAAGFSVTGEYDVGPDQPAWRWRTEFAIEGEDLLTITAYNIMPDGKEGKAVETVYRRVDSRE